MGVRHSEFNPLRDVSADRCYRLHQEQVLNQVTGFGVRLEVFPELSVQSRRHHDSRECLRDQPSGKVVSRELRGSKEKVYQAIYWRGVQSISVSAV